MREAGRGRTAAVATDPAGAAHPTRATGRNTESEHDSPAAVLSSQVRRRILEHLTIVGENAPKPTSGSSPRTASAGRSAAELAAYLGLHVTTVRFHLDQLVAGGFLVTAFERSTRVGRPRKLYAAPPPLPAESHQDLSRHFEVLAGLLATSWPTDGRAPATPQEAGRRWATDHADPATATTESAKTPGRWLAKVGDMVDQLDEWGYTPALSTSHGGRTVTIELHNCPFLALARIRPDVVCGVHHGLITGALAHVGETDVAIDVRPFVGPTRCLVKVTTATEFAPPTTTAPITSLRSSVATDPAEPVRHTDPAEGLHP